jgi:hypothetical protein
VPIGISLALLLAGAMSAPSAMGQVHDGNSPGQPLARVAGQPIYEEALLPLIQAPLRQLKSQEYQIKSKALESVIDQKVLEAAAAAKGVSPDELLKQEIGSRVGEPTDGEVEAYTISLPILFSMGDNGS